MNKKNFQKAKWIFAVYLIVTLALLLLGYSVQKPKVVRQEFPFSITYSYQNQVETISDVYVGEYVRGAKYIGDDSLKWYGYVKDRNRLESDFCRIGELDGQSFSINLNMEPGYLMGDPRYDGSVYSPTLVCHSFDGTNETVITDPVELEKMGVALVSWEYPEPIENWFSNGGISLSSEATLYTSVIAIVALLACMILIRKDPALVYGKLDKLSAVLNFLVALVAFPFIFVASSLSEIVADASALQQILYLAPAVTVLGVGASVALRRCGYRKYGLLAQFIGPVLFVIPLLLDVI